MSGAGEAVHVVSSGAAAVLGERQRQPVEVVVHQVELAGAAPARARRACASQTRPSRSGSSAYPRRADAVEVRPR